MAVKLGALLVELLWSDGEFTKGMKDAQRNLVKFGDSMETLTGGIAAKFELMLQVTTAALTGIAAAATVVGAEFEQKITKVAVIAGASVDELAAAARRMGASTQFSATEAADAMMSLAQAGFETADIIGGTEAALALAAASGSDLADATKIVATTMSQFGFDASQATRIADVFTQALNSSQLNMADLTVAMSYAGTVGQSFGHTLEETTAAVAMFSNLGLEGSKAGTAFRMAMSQAATVSKAAEAALKKYGLTAKDINPELYNFGEILDTVGEKGITASDAMIIFGTEVGGNVAALAKQSQEAGRDIGTTFTGIVDSLRDSEGAAAETAKAMTQTVLGAWEQVTGAFEELLLTIFDQYRGPLQALLLEVAEFINKVAIQFKFAAGAVSDDLGTALDDLRVWLDENGDRFAALIVIWYQRLVDVGRQLAAIIPWLDEIAILMGVIWAVNKIVAFAGALASAYEAVIALQAILAALGVELTAMTGGLYAVVVAVGALVAGLVAYIAITNDATEAAKRLTDAQDKQRKLNDDAVQSEVAAMEARLATMKEAAQAELATGNELSKIRRGELEAILRLDAASAVLAKRKGELVEVDGELRNAASLVEEAFDTASTEKLTAATGALRGEQRALEDRQATLKAKIDEVSSAMARGEDGAHLLGAAIGASTGEAGVNTIEDAQARYLALGAEIERLRGASVNLKSDVVLAQRAMTDAALETSRANDRAARSTVDFSVTERRESEQTAKKLKTDREAAAKAAETAYRKVLDTAEETGATELQLIRIKRDQGIRDLSRTFEEAIALGTENAGDMILLEARKVEAIAALNQSAAEETAAYWKEWADKVEESITEPITRLEATIGDLDDPIQKSIAAVEGSMGGAGVSVRFYWQAVKEIVGEVAKRIATVGRVTGDVAGKIGGLVTSLTGFAPSLKTGALGAAVSEREGMKEGKQSGFNGGAFATSFAEGLFAKADAFAALAVEVMPAALVALGAGIPGLMQTVVDTLPVVIDALVANVPVILGAVIDSLPMLISALVDALITVVTAVVRALPDLLVGVLGEALPKLIRELTRAFPIVIQAIVDGLPAIFRAIVDSLPAILNAIIDAIPVVIVAIVGAIPELILAIVEAIPGLIYAVIQALPRLLAALVGMIPALIAAIILDLPKLVIGIVAMIPQIVMAFLKGIIDGIASVALAFLNAITGGLAGWFDKDGTPFFKEVGQSIGSAFKKAGEGIKGWFDGKKGGSRAYSGIEYVAAPMRVTLDPGEAVLPADRNAERLAGQSQGTAGHGQSFPGGGSGGGASSVEVTVMAEGRVLDGILWRAAAAGNAPQIKRAIRAAGGVRVGIDRGRYSAYGGKRRK